VIVAIQSALLTIAVGAAWLGAGAFLLLETPYDKLHAAVYVAVVSGAAVTLAVILSEPFSAHALKATIIFVLSINFGAVLSHAIGHAMILRDESGDER
jgi:multisubunit Na+/H+ antiporter MnhG subunit